MKSINILIKQNYIELLDKCYYVEDTFDINQNDVALNEILKLDIFGSISVSESINLNQCFEIRVISNKEEKTFYSPVCRFYKDKFYTDLKDMFLYYDRVYIKDELLSIAETDDYEDLVLNYGFKPVYKIIYEMNFGFELEISCGSESNLQFLIKSLIEQDLLRNNEIILKKDNSIQGAYPVEIITAPNNIKRTYELAIQLSDIFKKFDSTAKGHNMGGMHIHCSYSIDNIKTLKLINFIYNRANLDFITKIAQRSNNMYCEYIISNITDSLGFINLSLDKNFKLLNLNRYSALNFTRHTIEFRIFNSNLRRERLLKNINFVESILSFISSKDYTENNKDFKSFVNKSRKYKYLKEFIKYLNEQ